MSHYHYSVTVTIHFVFLLIGLTFVLTAPSSIKHKFIQRKDETLLNFHQRTFEHTNRLKNFTKSIQDYYKPSHTEHENFDDFDDNEIYKQNYIETPTKQQNSHVVVLTSLSGIYVWWPVLFGGDDSFHMLLSQEEVPRFHDVVGDEYGHIYLTAPHERTVYRLQYADGWWIANFSNHSVMNSIRSEMPLFLNIHYLSSVLYVYGHSDIQLIDLAGQTLTRGSAPFMQRLRELSPNLRISDLIIDQLTSDGYIIGDSYGWCTVIRCSLNVNECEFLFKIPSSYDNRPYPCTATIDFSNKLMYLSLEEKILAVYLNQQTNFDRRFVLNEKTGPRSTLGYDDILAYNNTILYIDVLRPLLHICTSTSAKSCLNISLSLSPPQRTILPLRLSLIQVSNLRPPSLDEDESELKEESENVLNPTGFYSTLSYDLSENKSEQYQFHLTEPTTMKFNLFHQTNVNYIWMLVIGMVIGLAIAAISFMIYFIISNKNVSQPNKSLESNYSTVPIIATKKKSFQNEYRHRNNSKYTLSTEKSSDSTTGRLLESPAYSSTTTASSEWTTITTSSSSYRPDTPL